MEVYKSQLMDLGDALDRLRSAGGSFDLCKAVIDIAINAANHETVKLQVAKEAATQSPIIQEP